MRYPISWYVPPSVIDRLIKEERVKTKFKFEVKAANPESAFAASKAPGKTKFKFVTDSVTDVQEAIRGKKKRVEMNPNLYADKIAEYDSILKRIEANVTTLQPAEVVAEAMLDHGDSRLDNPDFCCVIQRGQTSGWIVFGFDFTK